VSPHQHLARLSWKSLAVGALLGTVAFAALTSVFAGDAPAWTAFDNCTELLVAVLATLACVVRAGRERSLYASVLELRRADAASGFDVALQRQTRTAWSLLAIGMGAWAAGQAGWTVYETGFGSTPPSPSELDVMFLGSSLLIVAGLLAMVRTPAGRLSHLRGAVEALFVASGFFLLSWSLIGPEVHISHASAFSQAINLAYPALDAVALSAVLFVTVRRSADPPAGLGLLGLGIVCLAVSDSAFWYLGAAEDHVPGVNPLYTGWVAGFLLIALGALRPAGTRQWQRKLAGSRLTIAVPALPAAAGILIVMVNWLLGNSVGSEGDLLGIVTVVVMVGVTSLVVVSYENRALMGNLEERVSERTAELRATERYYRALVQRSSDVVMVVDPDMQIRYVSDSIRALFGRPPEELEGRGLDALGERASAALTDALDRVALTPGDVTRAEWDLTDGTGRPRHAESTVTNLLADPHVGAFVLNTRDDTDRAALEEQLRHQAFHDPLTGLANRALLADRAEQAFARARRAGASIGVITLDLDAFKLVNDRLGHLAGDELLSAVAQRLQETVRPEDTVARIGGDEFVVLVDAVEQTDGVLALAERIRQAMDRPFQFASDQHTITASIGVAVDRDPHSNFEQLLSDADVAMYAVKTAGRDAVQLFEPSMHAQARERYQLQTELRDGLEREELWILYQPEFDSDGEHLEGFEALVRWNNPKRGLVQPDRFIPLAEETGLVVPLGRWVLQESLRQAAAWDRVEDSTRALTISVNVSTVQLNAPSFVTDVKDALNQSGIDPSRVVLEITESSLIDSSPRVVDVLHALKQLGVRIAIDDFGTGYASISYLQTIPVDILKIDRSFVTGSEHDKRGRDLLEAIVNIGRVLSLVTVAEGVEQPNQLATVKQMGCDLVQGYLFSRPLPAEEARHLIAEHSAAAASGTTESARSVAVSSMRP
jgi:diguanylate cyclase (GGDEF)-like protein/PAS domain S-box-containing protein